MSLLRSFTNICSDNLQITRDFYIELLGFEISYDSDWYVLLCNSDDKGFELGIIKRSHELVPTEFQTKPSGMYITFVVQNVDEIYRKAISMGVNIIQKPQNEFYGQRRFLVADPSGCLLDICSPFIEQDEV